MIFSIQRYLEDYFARRGFSDIDQYAIKIANLYSKQRPTKSDDDVLREMHRISTVFFRNNSSIERVQFEDSLLRLLDNKFKKKALL